MAIHTNSNSLTAEVIEEYLNIANLCIATKKQDGGIYGYPATLPLFCVINAIGSSLIAGNEPFHVLKQAPFNCGLDDREIKRLEKWHRNLLVHNGMIAPGTCLSPDDSGAPFTFRSEEPVLIRVKPLYNLVRSAWEQVDKVKLSNNRKFSTNPEIDNPIFLSGATASMPVTASGSIYVPPPRTNSRTKKS
jgi:hypothetical protein